MSGLAPKVLESLRREGLLGTAQRVVSSLRYRRTVNSPRYRRNRATIFALPSAEQRFTEIYKCNYWLGGESASGPGSSIRYTSNLQADFRYIIRELSIREVFDGPCGDFNWMKAFLQGKDIDYIGADIVAPLIDRLAAEYSSPRISFMHLDLTCDPFPSADLMLCRDCLFHLSYADTELVLRNFLSAKIRYLFTSNHRNDGDVINRDIVTGDFRHIDLFSAPYYFPPDPLYSVHDSVPTDPTKQMCLWSCDQVEEAFEKLRSRV
ncbi:MAG: hypothetical protein JWR34_4804 [Mycobacterium sp.]|nr:hypothetical protein [Mycobacterium sp.]